MASSLVPLSTQAALTNLDAFISKYRALGAWGKGEQSFEINAWPIDGVATRGKNGFIYFARRDYVPKCHIVKVGQASSIPDNYLQPAQFRDFAKAILAHLHQERPSSAVQQRLTALMALLVALEESGTVCPTEVSVTILERTCDILQSEWRLIAAPQTAGQLAIIWKAMIDNELVTVPAYWKNPLRIERSNDKRRIGPEFDRLRMEKLPDPRALEASAELFLRDDTDVRTTFVTSAVALMLCSPDRATEFIFAESKLLSDWADPNTGEKGVSKRWRPAKGATPLLKTVVPPMREIAIRAYERIYKLTEPGRKLARWYEANPDKVYLPSHLEYLRDQAFLSQQEARAILYGGEVRKINESEHTALYDFLKRHNVPRTVIRGVGSTVTFADLEKAVLLLLPKSFPVLDVKSGLKYSDALCVMREGEFAEHKRGYMPAVLQPITYSMLQQSLNATGNGKTIFEKHGFGDDQGGFLWINTHQLRHYLNTLVRRTGTLSEQEIALWSGRKDVSQNIVYDHISVDDRLHKAETQLGFHSDICPFGNIDDRIFIRRNQFGDLEIITAHTSQFGYCVHDFTQSPCQLHQDCIQCSELVCIKGDERSRRELEAAYSESLALTHGARLAYDADMLGSFDWYKAHSRRENLLKDMLNIFNNLDVPDGTPIRLNIKSPNRVQDAISRRAIPIKPVAASICSMDDAMRLLATPAGDSAEVSDAD